MSDEVYLVPCERPENDAEDWFIEKDGKQYVEDELISEEERASILDGTLQGQQMVAIMLSEAEQAAVDEALVRRRHAKDKCWVECYFRLECLTLALETRPAPTHGTWGGYYPEELKQIRNLRDKKQKAREGTDSEEA